MSLSALRITAALGILAVLTAPGKVHGLSAWYEGFEGPEPTWQDAGSNARYRILLRQRTQDGSHIGNWCERWSVAGDNGTYVHISHEVGRPQVIEELLPTIWIKSDRPGLQLLARVVLPRTKDPRSGRPVSTLLRGSSYTDVGRWQQLRIDDPSRLLARQVRILRSQLGPDIDGREAHLDRVVLNVYGGPGTTNVWIDDLDIAGYVELPDSPYHAIPAGGSTTDRSGGDTVGNVAADTGERRRVQLKASVLLVDGRPMFPRVIRHQGEPLALLQRLGFNAVWLDGPASSELLREADRLGLWLICLPPRPVSPYLPDGRVVPLDPIGPQYRPVLIWELGKGLSESQLDSTRGWAREVRRADRRQFRPLICRPDGSLREYSRYVDLLLIDRQPLGTSLELADWATWIRRQPLLARPGTTIWTTIQTQPTEALQRQLAALEPSRRAPLSVASEQIRLLVYTAVGCGSRGLFFQSQSPLNADDPETRQRAMVLELLNLELQMIEPWAAVGGVVATARGDRPEVAATVLRTERSRLLLPIWSAPGAQFVPGQSAANSISLVVPGVPESSRAYELDPGGLQPLRHKRVTLGTRVSLEEFGLTGRVLFAQDPLVVNSLTRRSAEIAPRAAQLQRELAAWKLHAVGQVAAENARVSQPSRDVAGWMDAARRSLQSCDGHLAAGSYDVAYLHARRTTRTLRLVERTYWEMAIRGAASPLSSPAAVSFATLPWHRRLNERIAASRLGANRLPGGEFEDLYTMLRAGWNHLQHAGSGLETAADLVSEAAHSGGSGLRLTAAAADPENPPALVETPPVWITTPRVPVETGQLVCIHGWAHVPAAITGSVDGLLVIDSLAGEALAERIGRTAGWQEFTLYRVAPGSGQMTVTFALSGLGEVRLDDVTIQVLEPRGLDGITRRPLPASPQQ